MSSGATSLWLLVLTILAILYSVIALPLIHQKRWPRRRVTLWYTGLVMVGAGVVGPVADRSHADFPSHVATHLLLGMAAPTLVALSAPVTLLLRALPVRDARRLIRFLSLQPVRIATHVVTAAMLSLGGMGLLYLTALYRTMHEVPWVGVAVQVHTLFAGYLFAAAVIGNDPAPHRPSREFRAAVLLVTFAGHTILARSLYAQHPPGVPVGQAEVGSQLMYYGGDFLEVIIIGVFCWQWYRSTRPRSPVMPLAQEPGRMSNETTADAVTVRQIV